MKMPNNDQSVVEDKKITHYLLSDIHETGKHKAKFFKRFGFDISRLHTFKNSLIQHSVERDIEKTITNEHGSKYELKCKIQTPDDRNPCIVTVWIIETGKKKPTLITAYAAKQQKIANAQ